MMDISFYKPGRFAYLAKEPFFSKLWDFVSSDASVRSMVEATKENKPAIYPLLVEIETQFEEPITSKAYREDDVQVLVNNMIKQILEMRGYMHIACGLCPQGRYIKQSGVYKKQDSIENT
jgi:hypothetical protein